MTHTVLLVIDIGNTNVSLGIFDYQNGVGELASHWRLSTHREQTSDELSVTLRSLFHQEQRDTNDITNVILSNVVPPLQPIWERACQKLFDASPLVVGPGVRTGMPVRYENPREVGADRIVNSVAAFELHGGPIISVDFGTATTFDCVSADGEYLGGVICPGIHVSMEALFERASKLHRVELTRPKTVIGKTTTGAIQSGLLYGYAGMVDAIVGRIRGELGPSCHVIATGGLARLIATESEVIDQVVPFLTLQGLRILFEKNTPEEGQGSKKEKRP
ncbi:MAG: type III pantothenate kinase [Myxococcota bacterium]